jgi:ferredoxin
MDLLRWPVIGPLARHRRARLLLQLPLLAVAVIVVVHGLAGPQLAPRNLATVLSWVHYRGLLVVAILAVGNLFCTACPMILVRDAGRRVLHARWRWPRILRNKWPAILLFVGVLFAYELFDLWSLPRATAWLVLAYFAAALVVDVLFSGASFCKYVCPIGQFSFLASTMSPTTLQVRDIGTCRTCGTVDCIKGRVATKNTTANRHEEHEDHEVKPFVSFVNFVARASVPSVAARRVTQRGCELNLFLPLKVGNLDCTLCLDCVHACPHDNIALASRLPGVELSDSRRRSGIGLLERRRDLAALVVVFTFGALLNAFAMTGAAHHVEHWTATRLGGGSEGVALAGLFVAFLVALPLGLLAAAACATRLLGKGAGSLPAIAARHVYALVPLGLGVWVAHYAFHFLTGVLTAIPVAQSAAIDLSGSPIAGEPAWTWVGMQPGDVFPLQLGAILLGAIGALAVNHRIARQTAPGRAARASVPWTIAIVGLAVWAAWILGQPMEMRGMGMPG